MRIFSGGLAGGQVAYTGSGADAEGRACGGRRIYARSGPGRARRPFEPNDREKLHEIADCSAGSPVRHGLGVHRLRTAARRRWHARRRGRVARLEHGRRRPEHGRRAECRPFAQHGQLPRGGAVAELRGGAERGPVAQLRGVARCAAVPKLRWTANCGSVAQLRWNAHGTAIPKLRRVAHGTAIPNLRRVAHGSTLAKLRRITHSSAFAQLRRVAHSSALAQLRRIAHRTALTQLRSQQGCHDARPEFLVALLGWHPQRRAAERAGFERPLLENLLDALHRGLEPKLRDAGIPFLEWRPLGASELQPKQRVELTLREFGTLGVPTTVDDEPERQHAQQHGAAALGQRIGAIRNHCRHPRGGARRLRRLRAVGHALLRIPGIDGATPLGRDPRRAFERIPRRSDPRRRSAERFGRQPLFGRPIRQRRRSGCRRTSRWHCRCHPLR